MTRRWPILAIFILSGAAGLIYEVVWARQLVLVFGNTTQAVSAILTGFFGGIAIGSVIGGRIADRARRALRMYGLLELILVVIVLLTPTTFRLLHDVYRGAFQSLEASPTILALIRFGLSLLALGPATILMGATLPTLTRHLSRDPASLTLVVRPALRGEHDRGDRGHDRRRLRADRAARADRDAARRRGLLGDRGAQRAAPGPPSRSRHQRLRTLAPRAPFASPAVGPRPRVKLALIVAYVSGLTSLGYQVLWTRLLASGTGDSTYVFTTILTVFLIGLALGAVAFNLARTRIRTINLLALGQVVIAVLVLLGMVLITNRGVTGLLHLTSNFGSLFSDFALPVVFVVLPATFVMGLTFPAASALIADPDGHVGSNAGLLLSANTLGAITGTFVIPFVGDPAGRLAGCAGTDRPDQRRDGHRAGAWRPDRRAPAALGDHRCGRRGRRRPRGVPRRRRPVHRPEHGPDPGLARHGREVGRGRHRLGPGRPAGRLRPALGRRARR